MIGSIFLVPSIVESRRQPADPDVSAFASDAPRRRTIDELTLKKAIEVAQSIEDPERKAEALVILARVTPRSLAQVILGSKLYTDASRTIAERPATPRAERRAWKYAILPGAGVREDLIDELKAQNTKLLTDEKSLTERQNALRARPAGTTGS